MISTSLEQYLSLDKSQGKLRKKSLQRKDHRISIIVRRNPTFSQSDAIIIPNEEIQISHVQIIVHPESKINRVIQKIVSLLHP